MLAHHRFINHIIIFNPIKKNNYNIFSRPSMQ